jgi:hypothetical protein
VVAVRRDLRSKKCGLNKQCIKEKVFIICLTFFKWMRGNALEMTVECHKAEHYTG